MAQASIASVVVHDSVELSAALRDAENGGEIRLAPGEYGELHIYVPYGHAYGAFPETVTIRSDDPDNPAIFTKLYLREVTNLAFEHVVFDFTIPPGTDSSQLDHTRPFQVIDSQKIAIRNSEFDGDRAESDIVYMDGYGAAIGLTIRGSQDVAVEGNRFHDWYRAALTDNSDDLRFVGNEVYDIRSDGFDFAGVQGLLIAENHMYDFFAHPDDIAHRDMIQFWSAGVTRPSTDVVIRNNVLDSGDGDWTQSIFIRNEAVDTGAAGAEMFYRNFSITDNFIRNAHVHGITVGETDGLEIRNNTLIHNTAGGDDGAVNRPGITMKDASRNVIIENNIAHTYPPVGMGDASWIVRDNLVVQRTDPEAGNHYDRLFIGATIPGKVDYAYLQPLPGGLIASEGLGADISWFYDGAEELTALLVAEELATVAPEGLARFGFDARYSVNAAGVVDPGDAVYSWDFGDGSFADGPVASHEYTQPGTYTVTLVVQHSNGEIDTDQRQVTAQDPLRLRLDAINGELRDGSSFASTPVAEEEPPTGLIEEDAIRLTDTTGFTVEDAPQIYDLDTFSVSFAMKAENGPASDGEIFRLHTAMRLKANADGELYFEFTNRDEEFFKLTTSQANTLDGRWHTVLITNDGINTRIYVDGNLKGLAQMPGGTQPQESWAPAFGPIYNMHGFDGLIDRFEIWAKPQAESGDGMMETNTGPQEDGFLNIDRVFDFVSNSGGFIAGAEDTGQTQGAFGYPTRSQGFGDDEAGAQTVAFVDGAWVAVNIADGFSGSILGGGYEQERGAGAAESQGLPADADFADSLVF